MSNFIQPLQYGFPETRGQLSIRKSIYDRPIEIERRTRFGDLEIDTIVGKKHQQSLVSTVDRKIRLLMAEKVQLTQGSGSLPNNHQPA